MHVPSKLDLDALNTLRTLILFEYLELDSIMGLGLFIIWTFCLWLV